MEKGPQDSDSLSIWQMKRSICCCTVGSDSSRLHGLQHTRLTCPSPSLGACPSSFQLNHCCHPTISSIVSLYPQSFPASGSFPMSQLFTSGGQSIGASASASVLPRRSECTMQNCSFCSLVITRIEVQHAGRQLVLRKWVFFKNHFLMAALALHCFASFLQLC